MSPTSSTDQAKPPENSRQKSRLPIRGRFSDQSIEPTEMIFAPIRQPLNTPTARQNLDKPSSVGVVSVNRPLQELSTNTIYARRPSATQPRKKEIKDYFIKEARRPAEELVGNPPNFPSRPTTGGLSLPKPEINAQFQPREIIVIDSSSEDEHDENDKHHDQDETSIDKHQASREYIEVDSSSDESNDDSDTIVVATHVQDSKKQKSRPEYHFGPPAITHNQHQNQDQHHDQKSDTIKVSNLLTSFESEKSSAFEAKSNHVKSEYLGDDEDSGSEFPPRGKSIPAEPLRGPLRPRSESISVSKPEEIAKAVNVELEDFYSQTNFKDNRDDYDNDDEDLGITVNDPMDHLHKHNDLTTHTLSAHIPLLNRSDNPNHYSYLITCESCYIPNFDPEHWHPAAHAQTLDRFNELAIKEDEHDQYQRKVLGAIAKEKKIQAQSVTEDKQQQQHFMTEDESDDEYLEMWLWKRECKQQNQQQLQQKERNDSYTPMYKDTDVDMDMEEDMDVDMSMDVESD